MKVIRKFLLKYKGLSKPAKASLWFIMCNIIQRGLQFIGMPIYTRIMSTEEYGTYSVFLSWFNIVTVFSSLSIYNGTFNKAMIKYEKERDKYISSIQSLTFIIGAVFSLSILFFSNFIFRGTGYSLKFQLLFCIYLLFFPTLQYWAQKQRFIFEYKALVLVTLLNSSASLVLGTLFVVISDDKSFALIAVTVIVQVLINLVLFYSLAKKGCCCYNKEYWSWSTITAIPLIPHYLSEILLGHADRLMIGQMCGNAKAGIYNIVYQISMVMTIIRTGINGSFTPWLYYSLKERKYDSIRRVTKLITCLMWLMTFAFIIVGPEILRIIAAPSYYEAVVDIPAIMIGSYFIFVYVLFLNVEIYYEENQYVAVASILAAIINIMLNYFCINRWGYLAAGYTTMISYFIMAILHYAFLKKISKKYKEIDLIFDVKFLIKSSLLLVIGGVLCTILYQMIIIRYVLLVGISVVVVVNKDVVINTLNELKNREK